MHSKMDTPPSFSYVCTDALFVKYKPEGRGSYDFQDKFYITNFQVKKRRNAFFVFIRICQLHFSFNHSMVMVHISVHQIIAHHFSQAEFGWVLHPVYFA